MSSRVSSLRFLRRRGGEGVEFHLSLLYLAALAQSDQNDRTYIAAASVGEGALLPLMKIFQSVRWLNEGWGFSLSDSLLTVARRCRGRLLRELLERLSQVVNLGVGITSMIRIEYEKSREVRLIEFERSMERLKTIGDAFTAMVSSSAFLMISLMIVSMLLSGITPESLLSLILIAISGVFAGLIVYGSRVSGRDRAVNPLPHKPALLRVSERLSIPLLISAAAVSFSAPVFTQDKPTLTEVMLLSGIALMATSLPGMIVLRKVPRVDFQLPFFIKNLSETLSIIESPEKAVEVLKVNNYGELSRHVDRLFLRLKAGISLPVAWRFFEGEAMSQLAYESGEVFIEAKQRGAPLTRLGRLLFDYLSDRMTMRRKRGQVAGYIKGTMIPLSVTIAAIMGLVDALLDFFSKFASMTSSYLPIFANVVSPQLGVFLILTVLVVALCGSFLIHVVEQRSPLSLSMNAGMTLTVALATYLLISSASGAYFNSLSGFIDSIRGLMGE